MGVQRHKYQMVTNARAVLWLILISFTKSRTIIAEIAIPQMDFCGSDRFVPSCPVHKHRSCVHLKAKIAHIVN